MSSKHVLFFVHGMGTHDKTWHEDGVKTLKTWFAEYPRLRNKSFDETFEYIPIVYDNIFETWRTRSGEEFDKFKSAALGSFSGTGSSDAKKKLDKQLTEAGKLLALAGDNFFLTHWLDSILYRFSTTIRMATDVAVADQILTRLKTPCKSWSVIAHSLGNSVAHNSLNSLYSTNGLVDEQGTIRQLHARNTRPRVLMMVANVSRVLQRSSAKVFGTRVRPGPAEHGNLCSSYLNVRHQFDPFCVPKPFVPDHNWLGSAIFGSTAYQHITPSHLYFDVNDLAEVHALDHYLMNPRVHAPLFQQIIGENRVTQADLDQAKIQFEQSAPGSSIDNKRNKLQALFPHHNDGVESIWSILEELLK